MPSFRTWFGIARLMLISLALATLKQVQGDGKLQGGNSETVPIARLCKNEASRLSRQGAQANLA